MVEIPVRGFRQFPTVVQIRMFTVQNILLLEVEINNYKMKNQIKPLLVFVGLLVSLVAWSQMSLPPSGGNPRGEVSQYLGLVKVTIVYNSPDVAGREIWGKLVPYGLTNLNNRKSTAENPSPWRAGANENTVVTFSHDATLQGKPVAAGSYGLFFIVNKDNTAELILSKDYRSWGNFWYDASHDAMRATVTLREVAHTEMLTLIKL